MGNSNPPTYTQDELERLFAACTDFDRVIFATLLLTTQQNPQSVNSDA